MNGRTQPGVAMVRLDGAGFSGGPPNALTLTSTGSRVEGLPLTRFIDSSSFTAAIEMQGPGGANTIARCLIGFRPEWATTLGQVLGNRIGIHVSESDDNVKDCAA